MKWKWFSEGGVGDFEILNSNQEVVIIGQKHVSTISFLENTSRSEVLTLELQNVSQSQSHMRKSLNL